MILGAGASGLAAAAALAGAGRSVCVLEARDRLGGRIWTCADADSPLPMELGAEFVHGRPEATLRWLDAAAMPLVDAPQAHWIVRGRRLEPAGDLFAEIKQLHALPRPRGDLSFSEFLEREGGTLSPEPRGFARMLVEGFDAADASRISARATLEEWSGAGAADAPTFRPRNGYGAMIDAMARVSIPGSSTSGCARS